MFQLWGVLVILIACPLVGAMPIIAWITYVLKGKRLAQIGTGNISVSAAFYHGGKLVGILAVMSEALKGIAAVLIARAFFPSGSFWELIALIALVIGRYSLGKGAGTTNVAWGFLMHDPLVAGFVSLVAVIGFIILRSRQTIKYGVLVLFPLLVALMHAEDFPRIVAAFGLAGLLGWIYKQIPDDMDLSVEEAETQAQAMMEYLSGSEQGIVTLDDELDAAIFGAKAATLSQIKRWGYPVPKGWILSPFDDPALLIDFLQPSALSPFVVRSSAIGEDSAQASAAGQYETILNVTSQQGLLEAIAQVQASYHHPSAVQYRRDLGAKDAAMAVLIQPQVQSVFSGVAFSRDPMAQQGDAVVIEALSGSPVQVVSGKITPEQYRVFIVGEEKLSCLQFEGEGKIPPALIKQVAYLARRLENRYYGIPQDVEWSYDGQTIWVLQSRPITTLLPIWTRKIAAEVIPGVIHPLTWSINLPLTCGMWGELFTLVLGDSVRELDFTNMATLHYSRAYFNATFLGEIFLEMGLPPESLDFLTRGAKMSKPPLASTWENLPGLTKLFQREISLEKEFKRDYRRRFIPGLTKLANELIEELTPSQLLVRVDLILDLLNQGTYYSILSPLSAAIRQAISGVKEEQIDHSITPEVASLRSLHILAADAKEILPEFEPESVFEQLAQTPEGEKILYDFEELLEDYGYLSEVGTDISVPTWREQPQLVKQLFVQLMQGNELPNQDESRKRPEGFVQRRVDLKGRVTEVYSRLLAELRWTFLALEKIWLQTGLLPQTGDIFFLKLGEIRRLAANADVVLRNQLPELLQNRRSQFLEHSQIIEIPPLVYGNNPPHPIASPIDTSDNILLGIPASQGQAEGRVKVLRNLQEVGEINKGTILVVPYTDSGWAPFLVRAGGVIAEAGGKLSHGAIVAREYGIPAVMDVRGATYLLQDGQQVKIDGSKGIVELQEFLA
ncbi:glycerol-3-phosphate acyltransferase [Anabaena lutea]|uniref:Glycerol-3-phosphate acyltransferase n=1 Tax=Anabaena lutea FACHB-196 TaxID=2692881 RepID=A0ABR8FHJ6_9NOST|nr:glycerol-3-phosphate acyltransferase [Anabaena lutea]MBD2569712.1 glycerol-3-phosphate acyltransferase [Anabaena lutea FACHB-196]